MLRRIILGLGANAFSQVITIVIQIFSLPLFLLYWDAATYGSWLVLSALPAYVGMADVGMVGAAGNKMTMAVGRSDVAEANRIYQTAQLFMTVMCCSLAAIIIPAALFLPLPDSMTTDKRIALAALMCAVLFALYGGLQEAVFKATGRYAAGTMLGQTVRLAEWGGYMAGLMLFRTLAGVAICGLVARAAGTAAGVYLSQQGDHKFRLGFQHASKAELLSMIRPAVSLMAFPLASGLSFQGVTLLVAALAGTTAVAVFNTYRTIARLAVQVTGMFSHAVQPEFSRLFGEAGMKGVRSLYRHSTRLGAVQSIVLSLVLYFMSPFLLRIWTHGRIEFIPSMMMWLLVYAAVGGVWHVPRILLLATNQHIGLAGWFLLSGILSVALGWLFGIIWQVNGICAAMLVSEMFIAAICTYIAHRLFAEANS
ncbi:Polysaccharide biosynthesis protein [Methylocella tundrae]|uniref:Polysaccharide biosynthesis protein n=1 Tax=Methylocella tundrae TaxID=227605 RepID=A0A8B6MCP2_METTU|nr:hypothetical protein [Methylocella tundrae]VTZ23068.1 Polysaccharide biosynthesis protein [Methylocella tundrae]VTZ52541.1 Polysaccharide biosynthesis protein [Methylocella tundrae]